MKKYFTLILCTLSLASIFACNKDDDDNDYTPPKEIVTMFNEMYPGAKKVDWEKNGNYASVDFVYKNNETEAWYFISEAVWVMTDTDLPVSSMPQAIKDAINASDYASWIIKDLNLIERPSLEDNYVVEINKSSSIKGKLYYTASGTLIKEEFKSNDGMLPSIIPSKILSFIATNYTGASALEMEKSSMGYVVYILYLNDVVQLSFDLDSNWIFSQWRVYTIPEVVINAYNSSSAGSQKINKVLYYVYSNGDIYYEFFYGTGASAGTISITPSGVVIE